MIDYYNYLCSIIDTDDFNIMEYTELLENLFHEKFYAIDKADENRIKDALYFRKCYIDNLCDISYDMSEPVNILELMVTLSRRIEDEIMTDMGRTKHTGKWFYIMIKNLGLSNLTNGYFDRNDFINIVVTFLNRNYEKNGSGGLFVVDDPNVDMRCINIWYQMHKYISSLFY